MGKRLKKQLRELDTENRRNKGRYSSLYTNNYHCCYLSGHHRPLDTGWQCCHHKSKFLMPFAFFVTLTEDSKLHAGVSDGTNLGHGP